MARSATLLGLVAFATVARAQIQVGANVQVSVDAPRENHVEVIVSADPADATRLIACAMVGRWHENPTIGEVGRSTLYVSSDGGTKWRRAVTTTLEAADPSCVFGVAGAAFFAAQSSRAWTKNGGLTLELHRSSDGGITWSGPIFSRSGDRTWIIANGTSLYAAYQGRLKSIDPDSAAGVRVLVLKRSTNGGETWISQAFAGVLRSSAPITPMRLVVLPTGAVGLFFRERGRPTSTLKFMTSSDSAESFNASVRVADEYESPENFGVSDVAIDTSDGPFRGRLYAVWTDHRSGRDVILLSYSADSGGSWSPPTQVNDDSAWIARNGPDDCMPAVAVNRFGVVAVSWYDRRDNPDNAGYFERFSASINGGQTWLPSVRVSESPNRVTERNNWMSNGHTSGLTADASGTFHPVWVDNRTGYRQVWTSTVRVSARTGTVACRKCCLTRCASRPRKMDRARQSNEIRGARWTLLIP